MISRTNFDLKKLREKTADLKLLVLMTRNAKWHYERYLAHLEGMNKMLEEYLESPKPSSKVGK